MHRVRGEELVGDDEVDPFVLLAKHRGVGDQGCLVGLVAAAEIVGVVGERLECGLRVVDLHDGVVDEPLEDAVVGGDLGLGNGSGWHGRGGGLEFARVAGGLLEVGDEFRKRLIETGRE